MSETSWFVKVIRSGARYEDGTLPPEVWREKVTCPTLNAFDNSGDSRAVVTIVHSIQNTVIGRADTAGPQGKGYGEVKDPMFTVDTSSAHAISVTPIQDASFSTIVRRLTPKECERLQGFSDDWTGDQSDSARYKQMGNAVTVNVVKWIGKRL